MALNAKQERFVAEYLIDLNATQAAVRSGYSARTAYSIGQRLLKHVEVDAAIAQAQAQRAARTDITADRVLKELAKVGFSNLSDVAVWGTKEVAFGYTDDGKQLPAEQIGDAALVRYVEAPFLHLTDRDELPENVRAAVSEVSLTKDGFKVKLHDKVGALTQMGRHLGMFTDKTELSGPGGTPLTPVLNVTIGDARPKPPPEAG